MRRAQRRWRGLAQLSASAGDYRLTSRDLGACIGLVLLFAWPVTTQLLREAHIAGEVLVAALGAAGVAIAVIPVGAGAYWIARTRVPWGWKLAAIAAALVGWVILCKLALTGQMAVDVCLGPLRALIGAGAAAAALALFRWGRDRHLPFAAAAIGALSLVVALRQLFFGPQIGDVYMFQQGLWTTLHGGGLFHVSDEAGSHFGTHWSPVLLALLPVYAIWPSAVPLLIAQSAALAAAAFPVHAILRRRWPEGEALALTTGFLLLPPVLGPTLWLFHEATFGLAAFVAALLYFERSRPVPFAFFGGLALLVRETMIVPVALFSLYALARRRGWRWVVLPTVGAGIYGAVTLGLVMPHFRTAESQRPFRYLYSYLGSSPGAAGRYLATHPSRALALLGRGRNRIYLEKIAAPYGYLLPLAAWPIIFGVPDAVAVLLARPSDWPVRDLTAHYSMLLATALFVAFAYSVCSLKQRLRVSRTPAALAAALFFAVSATGGISAIARHSEVLSPAAVSARRTLAAVIPRGASVFTTYAAASYVANRREVYVEREDPLSRRHPDCYLSYRRRDQPPVTAAAMNKLGYRLVAEGGGFALWRRDGEGVGSR